MLFKRPQSFFGSRTFGLVAMVYAGTYLVANTTDTILSYREDNNDIKKVTAGTAKFAATSRFVSARIKLV
ncbi:hypothetical protein H072_1804 [Dactylellina haptotyla CBS 200.50]|uniref:Uncharacterized protein n=1 Tax=Dactylellina haptotyla (strain CBS 200.50) TaxID=1284197 RepID=S8AMP5_DACHA|nr:hypothetical protein H072_1804 [Dactylellina haptotyla CBS 200.50]